MTINFSLMSQISVQHSMINYFVIDGYSKKDLWRLEQEHQESNEM